MVHGRWRAIGGPACVVQGKVGMRCCDLLCIGEAHKGWCLGCELGELVLRERRPGGGGGSSVGRMHGRAASGLGSGAQWLGFRGRQLERWALLEGKWYDFAALVDQRRCRSSATSRSLDAPSAGRAEAVPAATLIRQQPRARSGINERASDQKGTSVSPFLLHCCASAFFNEHCVFSASRTLPGSFWMEATNSPAPGRNMLELCVFLALTIGSHLSNWASAEQAQTVVRRATIRSDGGWLAARSSHLISVKELRSKISSP
ncbi:hypothetical protein ACCO45_013143 [Purpureocillium lilacinum]|uniref:Uncharacterized protein n=1 Tax=Purpureocillium lilacinum TaxID=33203 RepID=A0ACC4DA02_PURLI